MEGSSIHNCRGFGTYIKQSENIKINNNVFYWARKFLVYAEDIISKYEFTNNLMIGARKREEVTEEFFVDDVACYEQYTPIAYGTDHQIMVKYNLAQGSEG